MDVKKQYDKLLTDLLGVLDAVDQACVHWQQVEADMHESAESAESASPKPMPEASASGDGRVEAAQSPPQPSLTAFQRAARSILSRLEMILGLRDRAGAVSQFPNLESSPSRITPSTVVPSRVDAADEVNTSEGLAEIVASGREGAELIQRSLLDALHQHQITPISVQGKPFNPKTMFAIGRESDNTVPANTVLEEIVRGYQQGDKILREAQVIVSGQ